MEDENERKDILEENEEREEIRNNENNEHLNDEKENQEKESPLNENNQDDNVLAEVPLEENNGNENTTDINEIRKEENNDDIRQENEQGKNGDEERKIENIEEIREDIREEINKNENTVNNEEIKEDNKKELKEELREDLREEVIEEQREELREEVREDLRKEEKEEPREELIEEVREEPRDELREEPREELREEIKEEKIDDNENDIKDKNEERKIEEERNENIIEEIKENNNEGKNENINQNIINESKREKANKILENNINEEQKENIEIKRNLPELEEYEKSIKVIVLGDSSVGKSSLINRLLKNEFQSLPATLAIENHTYIISLNEFTIRMQIWDTAGQEKFDSIVSNYYKGTEVGIFIYSIDQAESFRNVQTWFKKMKENNTGENSKYILLGNKKDLEGEKRAISYEKGKHFADENNFMLFKEISCKSDDEEEIENIMDIFDEIGKYFYDFYKSRRNASSSADMNYVATSSMIALGDRERNKQKNKPKKNCCS